METQARIVNYADHFVLCCRGTAQEAVTVMRDMMAVLKLTANEIKTLVRHVPVKRFDFFGLRFWCALDAPQQTESAVRGAEQEKDCRA